MTFRGELEGIRLNSMINKAIRDKERAHSLRGPPITQRKAQKVLDRQTKINQLLERLYTEGITNQQSGRPLTYAQELALFYTRERIWEMEPMYIGIYRSLVPMAEEAVEEEAAEEPPPYSIFEPPAYSSKKKTTLFTKRRSRSPPPGYPPPRYSGGRKRKTRRRH
jgi:hypothetical protein